MNKSNTEDIIETESAKPYKYKAKPLYIGLGLLAILALGAVVIWFLAGRNKTSVVPAPRNISFDGTSNADSSEANQEQTITIPTDQLENANIKIETVGETLSGQSANISSTGVVQANSYTETPVISLVGGVVRKINIVLGQYVRKGQTVAVISSDELARSQSNFLEMTANADEAEKRYKRALELSKVSQEARTELDQAEAQFKIAKAEHVEHLSHFVRTEKLLQIGAVSRAEFDMVKAKHESAMATLDQAAKRLERAKQILAIDPERKNEIDRTFALRQSAEAKADAERERLLILGLSPSSVEQLSRTHKITSNLPIESPISGTVTSREINVGEVVLVNKAIITVSDLSKIWVIAEVNERDISKLRVGSGASITSDAYSERLFRGHVTYIDPNLNQETRTAQVRVELQNPDQILKIGMYVNIAFGSMGNAESTSPIIPASAVQTIRNRTVVFVTTDKPNVFILRQVRLEPELREQQVVLEGLQVGDRVVTDGSFLLRAEWLKQNASDK